MYISYDDIISGLDQPQFSSINLKNEIWPILKSLDVQPDKQFSIAEAATLRFHRVWIPILRDFIEHQIGGNNFNNALDCVISDFEDAFFYIRDVDGVRGFPSRYFLYLNPNEEMMVRTMLLIYQNARQAHLSCDAANGGCTFGHYHPSMMEDIIRAENSCRLPHKYMDCFQHVEEALEFWVQFKRILGILYPCHIVLEDDIYTEDTDVKIRLFPLIEYRHVEAYQKRGISPPHHDFYCMVFKWQPNIIDKVIQLKGYIVQ